MLGFTTRDISWLSYSEQGAELFWPVWGMTNRQPLCEEKLTDLSAGNIDSQHNLNVDGHV